MTRKKHVLQAVLQSYDTLSKQLWEINQNHPRQFPNSCSHRVITKSKKQRMCHQPLGTGVWTWQPRQTSVLCRAELYLWFINIIMDAVCFRKCKPCFFFWEVNLVAKFQVILFCRAGWEGCLHGDTDRKIHMWAEDVMQWDVFVLNISAVSLAS